MKEFDMWSEEQFTIIEGCFFDLLLQTYHLNCIQYL